MQTQTKGIQKLITFSTQLYRTVDQKARRIGLSFPEYIRVLAVNDIKVGIEDVPMVDEDTEKQIGQSLKDYEEGRYTTVRTKKELHEHLIKLSKQALKKT